MPQNLVVPKDGSSVASKEFGKRADEALRQHHETLTEQQRELQKGELALQRKALEAAKAVVKALDADHVYVVVSSAIDTWPPGQIIDVRVETRPQPANQPSAEQLAAAEAERAAAAEERRDALEVGIAQSTEIVQPGGRAEEMAAQRDISTPAHQVMPPATGGGPYMPGSRAEEIAAQADPSTLPQANPEQTKKLREKQARQSKRSAGGKRTSAARKSAKQGAASSTTGTNARSRRAAARKTARSAATSASAADNPNTATDQSAPKSNA